MVERLILDIGTGSGGEYLKEDQPGTLRICTDISKLDLIDLSRQTKKDNLQIAAVVCDCSMEDRYSTDVGKKIPLNLPFKDESFDKIEIFFPCDVYCENNKKRFGGLLSGLITNPRVFQEFYRVLKPNGKFEIITEEIDSIFRMGKPRQSEAIYDAANLAEKSGLFEIDMFLLSDNILTTNNALIFAREGYPIYRIIGTKNDPNY